MSVELDLPDLSSAPAAGSPLLDLLRPTVGVIARNLWRTTEHHRDRIPNGRCILAVNHVGLLDGPLVVALNQDAQAMAKKELWKVKPLGHFLDAVGQVPIDRWNPDPGSIRRCIAVLQAERRLVIFPEQHRGNGDFAQFKRGTAYLAMVTGAPVVPVALIGAATTGTGIRSVPRPRSRVDVVYGDKVDVAPKAWPRTAGEVADLTAVLQLACQQNLQQAQQELGLVLH